MVVCPLEYGANPNVQDIYGKTALHLLPEQQPIDYTSVDNKVNIVKVLFKHGANISKLENNERELLWYAVFYYEKARRYTNLLI